MDWISATKLVLGFARAQPNLQLLFFSLLGLLYQIRKCLLQMGTIPLNPPYQRGTFQIEVLSHLEIIARCHYICSILFRISY